ncbi:MAG: hypothetical protein QM689_09280 [Oscillospiraceae bacterium]
MDGYGTYNQTGGYDGYNTPPLNIFEPPRVKNSHIWYAALLPLFALYLEQAASNIVQGAALWILFYVLWVGICVGDARYLRKVGAGYAGKPALAVFPPLYFISRGFHLKTKSYVWIVSAATVLAGLQNSFLFYATADADDFITKVQSAPLCNVEQLADETASLVTLQDVLTDVTTDADWSYSSDGERHIVTFRATYLALDKNDKNIPIELVFEYKTDGFASLGVDILRITADGVTLTDEQAERMADEIFFDEPYTDDSTVDSAAGGDAQEV